MKVAIVTTTGFHLKHLARELDKQGIDVRFYTSWPKFRAVQDGLPRRLIKSVFWQCLPWSLLAIQHKFSWLQKIGGRRILSVADRRIKTVIEQCDVMVGLASVAIETATEARQRFGAKIIIDSGSRHVLTQHGREQEYIARELTSYEVADYICVPSSNACESFVECGVPSEKLFVNCYGVDLERFHRNNAISVKEELLRVAYVGAWSYRKGCDILSDVITEMPNVILNHAGTILDAPFIENERMKSYGHIGNDSLAEFLENNDVLVLPSRDDGFGMVLLEALSVGLPVIATEKTGGRDIKSVITDKSVVQIVRAESRDELAAAIQHVQAHRRNFTLTPTDKAYFSWDGYAKRYKAFLSCRVPSKNG